MIFMKYANKLLGVPNDNIWAFVEDRKTSAGFIKSQWNNFLSLVEDDAIFIVGGSFGIISTGFIVFGFGMIFTLKIGIIY